MTENIPPKRRTPNVTRPGKRRSNSPRDEDFDAEIRRAIKRGAIREAAAKMVEAYGDYVKREIAKMGCSPEDVEEIYSAACEILLIRLPTMGEGYNFGYLFKIQATYAKGDYYRTVTKLRGLLAPGVSVEDEPCGDRPSSLKANTEEIKNPTRSMLEHTTQRLPTLGRILPAVEERLNEYILSLPEVDQTVFRLHVTERLNFKEVARRIENRPFGNKELVTAANRYRKRWSRVKEKAKIELKDLIDYVRNNDPTDNI